MPQQGGGAATNLLVTLGQLTTSSLCCCLPAAWAGAAWLEMAVLRAMCPQAVIRGRGHRGCEGDECGSQMTAVGWGMAL